MAFHPEVVLESDVTPEQAKSNAKERLEGRVPPGYKDADKSVNAAGDVLIWHTVLTVGRTRPQADVILISGDAKSDWFYRSENIALYPRFELIDEYRRASKGGSFHILTFADFLQRLQAPAAVVEEVQVSRCCLKRRDQETTRGSMQRRQFCVGLSRGVMKLSGRAGSPTSSRSVTVIASASR